MCSPNPYNVKTSKDKKEAIIRLKTTLAVLRGMFGFFGTLRVADLVSDGAVPNAIAGLYNGTIGRLLNWSIGRFSTWPIYHGHVNPTLFTWNSTSVTVLGVVGLAAATLLWSFRTLGKDATFDLQEPESLVTTGVYSYIQHPSYTMHTVVTCGMAWWLNRWDGTHGAFFPPGVFQFLHRYQLVCDFGLFGYTVYWLGSRLIDEEVLLRHKFGKKYEAYQAKTARFIPYIL